MGAPNERLTEGAIRARIPKDRRPYVVAGVALLQGERRPEGMVAALRLLSAAEGLNPPMPSVTAGIVRDMAEAAGSGEFNVVTNESCRNAAQMLLASVLDMANIRYPFATASVADDIVGGRFVADPTVVDAFDAQEAVQMTVGLAGRTGGANG